MGWHDRPLDAVFDDVESDPDGLSTYHVPAPIVLWDLPFKLVVGVGLLAWVRYGSERALGRREGAARAPRSS